MPITWSDSPGQTRQHVVYSQDRSNQDLHNALQHRVQQLREKWHWYAVFATFCVANFTSSVDMASTITLIPVMSEALELTELECVWAQMCYPISATALQPVFSLLHHHVGKRLAILFALTFCATGAIVTALAVDHISLLVGRSLQGVGSGACLVLTYVVTTEKLAIDERGKWFGWIMSLSLLGSTSGPFIGRIFAGETSWRWAFWLELPLYGLNYAAITTLLYEELEGGQLHARMKDVDWIGCTLFTSSIFPLLLSITYGASQQEWLSSWVIGPVCLACLGLGLIIMWYTFVPQKPVLAPEQLLSIRCAACCLGSLVHGMIAWSVVNYMPPWLEAIFGYSGTHSRAALLPWIVCGGVSAALLGGKLIEKDRIQQYLQLGWILVILGLVLLSLVDRHTNTGVRLLAHLSSAIGASVLSSAIPVSAQLTVEEPEQVDAATLHIFFHSMGQVLGFVLGETSFHHCLRVNLHHYPLLDTAIREQSTGLVDFARLINKTGPGQIVMKSVFAAALAGNFWSVWVLMAGLAIMAFLTALFSRSGIRTKDGHRSQKQKADGERRKTK